MDRAAARSKDLQLEAEEVDASFIADELDRQTCISIAHADEACHAWALCGAGQHGGGQSFRWVLPAYSGLAAVLRLARV